MVEGWLQNLKIQQDFWKRMHHRGRVDLGVKGPGKPSLATPRGMWLPHYLKFFDAAGTIVQQHPFIGGAAPHLRGCARTEWPHRAWSCIDTVFYLLFSSWSPTPLINFCGGKRRRLLTSAPAAAESVPESRRRQSPRVLPVWALLSHHSWQQGFTLPFLPTQHLQPLSYSSHPAQRTSHEGCAAHPTWSWGRTVPTGKECLEIEEKSSVFLLWLSCSHSKWASDVHQFSHNYWARPLPEGLCRLAQSHGGETSVSPLHKDRMLSSPTLPFLKAGRCVY